MQIVPWTSDLAQMLAPMFTGDRPIPIRLWAALDGVSVGRIVVDQLTHPTLALVQEMAEGTTYMAGTPIPQMLTDAFTLLRTAKKVVVCLWPADPLHALLPAAPVYEGTAIDFTGRSPAVDLARFGTVPAGYHLRPIDAGLVPVLAGFDYYVAMFGSVARALEQTIGYCLLHDDKVVCEAVAGPLTRGVAEIGIGTAEGYRRQGLATLTAAWAIQACEAQGYAVFWNAAQQNVASVARRLGFQTERSFRVLVWDAITS